MKNFIKKGHSLTATLAFAVASGQLVQLGNTKLPAVAAGSYVANQEGEYQTRGVFSFPANAASVGAVGDVAYWDADNGVVTATAGTNAKAGVFAAPKAANDTTASIALIASI